MLRKFTVTNYKNFQGTVCMDFTDVRKYDFNTQCVKNGLLNKALVLGKNGIGKTNLGLALFDISYTLTENMVNPLQVMPESFLNAYSNERFATFEYEFQQGNDIIVYTYRKNTPTNSSSSRFNLSSSSFSFLILSSSSFLCLSSSSLCFLSSSSFSFLSCKVLAASS